MNFARINAKNRWLLVVALAVSFFAFIYVYSSMSSFSTGGNETDEEIGTKINDSVVAVPEPQAIREFNMTEITSVFSRISRPLFGAFYPDQQELLNLHSINKRHNSSKTMCLIGFNPYIVLAQLQFKPQTIIYSFHRSIEDAPREYAYSLSERYPQFFPIIGNPMNTIRSFAGEFGYDGASLKSNYSMDPLFRSFIEGKDPKWAKYRNLLIDQKLGVTCDIIYHSEGYIEELYMSALLATQNTTIIYKPFNNTEPKSWAEAVANKTIVQTCNSTAGSYFCGEFVRAYGQKQSDNSVAPKYDGQTLIDEHRNKLKKLLAGIADVNKTVIWIPVGNAHRHLADMLYCSLRALNVSNYMFFAHDYEVHRYFLSRGRNSYYDDLWFTTMEGLQPFHSFKYNSVMRERFGIILEVMDLGFNILMHDADIYWVVNVLPDLADGTDIVAQMDSFGLDWEFSEVCGGFVLYRNTPGSTKMMHMTQQMAFYFPALEDQELSNLVFQSKLTCLLWFDKNVSSCKPGYSVSVQYKDPRTYLSGHYYCYRHDDWAATNSKPKMIHFNGAVPSKEQCIHSSTGWGYPIALTC